MRVSLTAWAIDPGWYVPLGQALEAAGFETLWVSDHVATPLEYRRVYPYNESGEPGYTAETPLVDIWPVMGALAASTNTLQLGSGVLILPLRNPFLTAHAVATVQNLSHGRFLFGVGTGWMEEEFTVLGESFAARGARTEEILDVLEKLWTGRPTSHEGRFYRFPLVTHPPAPVRPVPLIGCGLSEGMLRRTARRMQGWYGPAVALDVSMRAVLELDRLRAESGRGEPFQSYVRLEGALDDANLERHRRAGVDHLVLSMSALGIPPSAGLEERLETIARAGERLAGIQSSSPSDGGRPGGGAGM